MCHSSGFLVGFITVDDSVNMFLIVVPWSDALSESLQSHRWALLLPLRCLLFFLLFGGYFLSQGTSRFSVRSAFRCNYHYGSYSCSLLHTSLHIWSLFLALSGYWLSSFGALRDQGFNRSQGSWFKLRVVRKTLFPFHKCWNNYSTAICRPSRGLWH